MKIPTKTSNYLAGTTTATVATFASSMMLMAVTAGARAGDVRTNTLMLNSGNQRDLLATHTTVGTT